MPHPRVTKTHVVLFRLSNNVSEAHTVCRLLSLMLDFPKNTINAADCFFLNVCQKINLILLFY